MASLLNFYGSDGRYVVIFSDLTTSHLNGDHPNYDQLVDRLATWDEALSPDDFNVATQLVKLAGGRVQIEGDTVFFDGEPLNNSFEALMIETLNASKSLTPFANFLVKLHNNPSARSIAQFMEFVVRYNVKIDDEGFCIFDKGVNNNYTDVHTGQFDNSIGAVVEMARNKVDDNPDAGCSFGFHVGNYDYVKGFGTRKMIVRVDPADVVSVPHDCSYQKIRVCKYVVIGEAQADVYEERHWNDGNYVDLDTDDGVQWRITMRAPNPDDFMKPITYVHDSWEEDLGDAKDEALNEFVYEYDIDPDSATFVSVVRAS